MEKDACRCKKSKYYHNKCGCKSKRCKKKIVIIVHIAIIQSKLK